MPIKAAELIVDITADVSKLSKGTQSANDLLGKFSKTAMIAGAGMTAAITVPAIAAAKGMFEVAASMEQSKVAFTTMLGSAKKAESFLSDLQEFAAQTPFEFPELQDAARRMLAFGFSAEDVLPMMRDIGDAVAGLGLGTEGVNRVTLALGQMRAKSKVSAQEMMQLTEAGIPAWGYLAEAMGKSTQEVMKLSEQGLIPADQAIQAILTGMRDDFGGMMADQAETANGQISNLKDSITQLSTELGEALLPIVKELIGTAQNVVGWFSNLSEGGQKAVLTIGGLAAVAGPATTAIGGIAGAARVAMPFLKSMGTSFALMGSAQGIGEVLSVAKLGLSGIASVALPAAAAIGAVAIAWNHFVTEAKRESIQKFSTQYQDVFNDLIKQGKGVNEILDTYTSIQKQAKQAAETDWTKTIKNITPEEAISNAVPTDLLGTLILESDAMTGAQEALNQALLQTTTTYDEYTAAMSRVGAQAAMISEADWEAQHSLQQVGEAAAGAVPGLEAMGSAATPAFDAVASAAERTQTRMGDLLGQIDSIKANMDNWVSSTAGNVVSMLGQNLPESSQLYKDALGAVDEILDQDYLKQYELKDAIKALTDQYARTGDLEAFKNGLQEIKDEGLADMQEELEITTTRVQELYDKLLALPKEIQVEIGFDVKNYPDWLWLGSNRSGGLSIERGGERASGGPVYAGLPYLVGERGAELFIPNQNGRIEPNASRGVKLTNYGVIQVGSDEPFGVELLSALT